VRNFTSEEINGVSPLERAWLRPLLRAALRDADTIGCVSDEVRSDILEFAHLDPAKVTTTYNPILPAINHDPNVGPDRWRTGRRRLLSIGRLAPQKDHRTLLDAVSRIRHDFPVELIILGEGPLRPDLERQIGELQLSDVVSLRGYHPHPESYLETADALILSSRFEGFPNVVGEALASGCNVVATDSPGGVRELLDNGRYGFLCKVGDPDSLASAIRLALQRPKARDELMGRARLYTIEKVAQDYIDLFTNAHANWKNRESGAN
jgi:glycosyltransferase involved in cell wall biosynthesis